MSAGFIWLAFAAGAAFGALAALVWRARREQSLTVEMELLRSSLATEEAAGAQREHALARAREQLQAVFGDLARESLQSNSEVFLQLARERLARQQQDASQALKERETAIESLVRPIREALAKTEAQIQAIERDRIDSFASIKTQMEGLASGQNLLSRETRNLVTALRRPDVRGQWGEITLRRLVELSGMTLHVDFTEQHHRSTESGAIRPDMIVHMPDKRDIVLDVKTPLDAYLAAIEAPTDEARRAHLRRHAQGVGARVRELSTKQYWSQFERSPDFVILFLPGDQFLTAALQENPGLIDEALHQNVMLATPTSLIALLKIVAYGWKQSILADNAAEIRRLGEDLYKRLAVFGEHLGKLGKSLGSSVDSFNKAVGSLEQQVLPAARRFPDLGLRMIRELEPIEPVSNLTRIPRAADVPAEASADAAAPDPVQSAELAPARAPTNEFGGSMIPAQFTPDADLLAGRVILITGAGSGLGRALAIECARAGASVILSGRSGAKLDRVYDEIAAMGLPQPAIALLDLASATAVDYDRLADTIGSEFGRLDGVVHCAAVLGDRTPLEQYDVPTWCKVLHVNLTAPFIMTQVLLPNLRKAADASVIFVSSGVVNRQRPFWGAYAVAKSGLESVRSMWSQELEGEPNIRVNSVNPGRMRTAMRAAAYPAEDPNTVPAPAGVSAVFLYLLSAKSRGIHGQYIEAQ